MSDTGPFDAVVAGHICLDLIPRIDAAPPAGVPVVRPGGLTQVGPAITSTGGAVSNTGLALHRLGVSTRLVGKVGDDLFGREVLRILADESPALAGGMRVVPGETTSYSVVVAPPGIDRAFLHCPGANDSFTSADVDYDAIAAAKVLHFGYPPIMRQMYADGGRDLARLLGDVKRRGVTTSLDLCGIDPASPAGRADWAQILAAAAPRVDLFTPSIDELLAALRRPAIDAAAAPDVGLLRDLSGVFLDQGCAVVLLKLGIHGLYARASDDPRRLQHAAGGRALAGLNPADWFGRECLAPAFEVELVNANGAGDCAIAGFLAAVLRGEALDEALTAASAVGACACQSADANTVPHWSKVRARIAAGWPRRVARARPAGPPGPAKASGPS